MKPINFPESNKVFTKPSSMKDDECKSMFVFDNGINKISCWKLSLVERLQVLIFGKIWVNLFSNNQPPISLTIKTPFSENTTRKKD